MSTITREEIDNLCLLARIQMSDDEKLEIAKDLQSILAYVQRIQEIDVSSVDEDSSNSVFVSNVFREDEVLHQGGDFSDDILQQAPKSKDGFFVVPKIL